MPVRRFAAVVLTAALTAGALAGCSSESWERQCSTSAEGVIECTPDQRPAKAFERGRATYPSIFDSDGIVALKFDVTQVSTPATLILDRQGRIAVGLRRATTVGELRPLVERIAPEGNG